MNRDMFICYQICYHSLVSLTLKWMVFSKIYFRHTFSFIFEVAAEWWDEWYDTALQTQDSKFKFEFWLLRLTTLSNLCVWVGQTFLWNTWWSRERTRYSDVTDCRGNHCIKVGLKTAWIPLISNGQTFEISDFAKFRGSPSPKYLCLNHRPKGFFLIEIFVNVSFRFIWIPFSWVYGHNTFFLLLQCWERTQTLQV